MNGPGITTAPRSNPTLIDNFFSSECELGATCGPFVTNPLSVDILISLLQIAYSRTGKARVVVDFTYPAGESVKCGIPRNTYLNKPFCLRLPGLDALLDIIRQKSSTVICSFKRDILV